MTKVDGTMEAAHYVDLEVVDTSQVINQKRKKKW